MSELLVRADAGEEVIITVRGRPTARIVPIRSGANSPDRKRWAEELRDRLDGEPVAPASSSREIIDDLRGDH
jgi:prevent-host-death family protein